jgi:hypothetical protein
VRAFKEAIAEMQAAGFFPEPANKHINVSKPDRREMALPAAHVVQPSHQDVPLTETQMEVWLSAQLSDEASCAFNESFTLQMHGQVDTEALSKSLQELVDRHDALRATIVSERSSLRFDPQVELRVRLEDLSTLPLPEREAHLQVVKREEASTPFNLSSGPVVRARLFRLAPAHHVLIFTSHHIICDGWSTNVLLDELARLYSARIAGSEAKLVAPVQFREYAYQQAQATGSEENSGNEAFWLNQFAQPGVPLELPTDRPRQAIRSHKGSTHRARIDAITYQQIKQAGARQGCTLFVTLLTGFVSLLHRLTAQNDIVVGIPTAGQALLEDRTLVGHCVNFLPIRVRIVENKRQRNCFRMLNDLSSTLTNIRPTRTARLYAN